jgi:hypothetical protein
MSQPVVNQPLPAGLEEAIRMRYSRPWRNRRSVRNQQANLFGQSHIHSNSGRNLNRLESGLRNATNNLAELTEAVYETRMMVGDSLAAIGGLSQQLESGFDVGQRTSDRILHVASQLRNEFRDARTQGNTPWQWLLFYWRCVMRLTVLAWQVSWSITRSTAPALVGPLCLCACGCYLIEGVVLSVITDIGLRFGSCCITRHFGLSYHFFRMFVQMVQFLIFNIGSGLVNCVISYFTPYAVILSEETGVTVESVQTWGEDVRSGLSDFIGARVREEVSEQVVPIVEELRNIPMNVLNATSAVLTESVSSAVYAPKAALNSLMDSMGSTSVDAFGNVMASGVEYGTAALDVGRGVASSAASGVLEYGSTALDVGKDAASKATKWWYGKGSGPKDPFAHINFLQGQELAEFNKTIGKQLVKLDHKMTKAFINKYGENTVLDKNASEIVVFMEKSLDLLLHSILPWMANYVKHARPVKIEPGLRKALILSAFCNVKTDLKSKLITKAKSRKLKTSKRRTLKF